MSINFTFNPNLNDNINLNQININGTIYSVGNPITRDLVINNNSSNQTSRMNSFNTSHFPNGVLPQIINNSVFFSDWGNDIFDSFGGFYLYNNNSDTVTLPLINTNSYTVGQTAETDISMNGINYNITHGYFTQGIYMFDISCEDVLEEFGFGMYGNLGSDSRTSYQNLTSNVNIVNGEEVQFTYFHNRDTGNSVEQLYIYFIPYDLSQNKNGVKNYTDARPSSTSDHLSIYSTLVTRGITVIMAKTADVIDLLMNQANTTILYNSVDDALEKTQASQNNKTNYKNFLRTSIYNLFNNSKFHNINYLHLQGLINQSKYGEFYDRELKFVLLNNNDIENLETINLTTEWGFGKDFYFPGTIGDKIKIQIGNNVNQDTYYLTFNGENNEVLSIDISNNIYGSKTIDNLDNSTFGDITVTMLGGGGIGANEDVPCLTNTCDVLTPSGYQLITNLRKGDKVITSKNEIKTVQKLYRKIFKIDKNNKPYLIKKGQLYFNVPSKDTWLSPKHAILLFENKWIKSNKLSNIQKWNSKNICYYNLQLDDYLEDNLVINGMVVESWDGLNTAENRNYKWSKKGKYLSRRKLI